MAKKKIQKVQVKNYIYFIKEPEKEKSKFGKFIDCTTVIFAFASVAVSIYAIVVTKNIYYQDNVENLKLGMSINKMDYSTIVDSSSERIKLNWVLEITNNSKQIVNIDDCEISKDFSNQTQNNLREIVVDKKAIIAENKSSFPIKIEAGDTKKISLDIDTKIPSEVIKVLNEKKLFNKPVKYSDISKVLKENNLDIYGSTVEWSTVSSVSTNSISFDSSTKPLEENKNYTVTQEQIPPTINDKYIPIYTVEVKTSKNSYSKMSTVKDDAIVDKK